MTSKLSFDPIDHVDSVHKALPILRSEQGRMLSDLIIEHDCKNCLELGFHLGKSSAYIASTLKALGRGHLVTMDKVEARDREPNIEQVFSDLELTEWATIYFEEHSYNWRLMRFLEANPRPEFDFVFIDGGHVWDVTGFGFLLVDRMVPVGGVVVFDDLEWTIERGIKQERWPKYPTQKFWDEYCRTPQVRKVFEILADDGRYRCHEWEGFGIAVKERL